MNQNKYNPEIHHRRSIRLRGYDYSRAGAYFITICTQNRECLFGEISDGVMVLNDAGKFAQSCWFDIPKHFPNAESDEFVVMPNHIHGIIVITVGANVGANAGANAGANVGANVGANNYSPLRERQSGTSKTIGSIIRGFKIGVTKWFRQYTKVHDVWQRNYYEHIIRNYDELTNIREYIIKNPLNWQTDSNNPVAIAMEKMKTMPEVRIIEGLDK